MSNVTELRAALNLTRSIIFLFGVGALLIDAPLGTILGILSLACWLWMPCLISIELAILHKVQNFYEKNKG